MLSKFNIITLFPKLIEQWLETGIIAKAHENELFDISTTDLREFGIGDYRQVDDAPSVSYTHLTLPTIYSV